MIFICRIGLLVNLLLAVLVARAQRVGIGTTAPTQLLDVNGSLRVRGLQGSGAGNLLGLAPDGTLQAQSPLGSASATASPQAPASLSTVPTDGNPYGVAVHPDGTRVYVINAVASKLQTFDVSGNDRLLSQGSVLVGPSPTGASPTALALNPAGTRAYVTYASGGGSLQAFALGAGLPTSLGTVPTGANPTALALNATGTRMYVLANSARTLQAYDASSNVPTSLGAAPTIFQPIALALNPAGTRAYVASSNPAGSQLETFNLSADQPASLGAVPLSGGRSVAVKVAGTRAYVATSSGNLEVFDLSGMGLPVSLGTVAAGSAAQALALGPAGTRAYVLDYTGALLTFDLSGTGLPVLLSTAAAGLLPQALALNAAGTRAYVANYGSSILQAYLVGAAPPLLGVGSTGALGSLDAASLLGTSLLPQAYGSVGSDGTDYGSTSNYTLTHTGVGTYRLRFAAAPLGTANLANAVLTATLFGSTAGLLSYNGGPGYLDVSTYSLSGAPADRGFSFSLYLP